jgi:hypothetical protein
MEFSKISKQQEYQELLEYLVALYGEEQIASFSEYAMADIDEFEKVDISTIINSSVYGY